MTCPMVASKMSLRLLWWPPTEHQCLLIYRCVFTHVCCWLFSVGNKVTTTNVSDILFAIMFADDTSMFINGDGLKAKETQLNSELKEVSIWLQMNKLSLNVEKWCFIVFKSVKKSDLEVNIRINDECLSRVSQVKFLGTITDDKLTWRPHIDYISKKFSEAIAIWYI